MQYELTLPKVFLNRHFLKQTHNVQEQVSRSNYWKLPQTCYVDPWPTNNICYFFKYCILQEFYKIRGHRKNALPICLKQHSIPSISPLWNKKYLFISRNDFPTSPKPIIILDKAAGLYFSKANRRKNKFSLQPKK